MLFVLGLCVVIGVIFPFPATKIVLGTVLALLYVKYLNQDMALGLALVAFSVPVQDLTPRAVMLFPGANIATAVLLLLLLFWWKHSGELRLSGAAAPAFPLRAPLLCFLVASALAIVQSWLVHQEPFSYLVVLFKDQFGFMLLAVVAFRTLTRSEQRWLVFVTIVCIDVLVSVQSVVSYGAGIRERSAGFIGGQPNLYGGFLAMQLPFLVALCASKEIPRFARIAVGLSLLVVLQALVLTGSRGAWLAVGIGMPIFAFIGSRRALPFVLAGALIMPMFFYGFSEDRLVSLGQILAQDETVDRDGDESFEYRIGVWQNLGEMVGFPYVWGNGFAQSDEAMQRLGLESTSKATHSGIVSLAVDMGAVGIALYAWILIVLWRSARQRLKTDRGGLGGILAAGFVGAIPALVVSDISGSRFQNGEIMAYFWLLGGMMLRESYEATAAAARGRGSVASVHPHSPVAPVRARA